MATDVIMPALGMSQETGKVLQWCKAPGETVVQGEPLLEVETDKVTVELEAPASGMLMDVTAAAGDDVPVGRVIAVIRAPNDATPGHPQATDRGPSDAGAPAASASAQAAHVAASPVAARIAAQHNVDLRRVEPAGERITKDDVLMYLAARQTPAPTGQSASRIPASPKARRLATEMGIDVARLSGTGPDGAVLAADVLAANATVTPAPQPAVRAAAETPAAPLSVTNGATPVPMSTAWRVMAERTTQSWTSVPHFYLSRTVHAGRLVAWRESAQGRLEQSSVGRDGAKITYADLLVKLVAAALRAHPRLNAALVDGAITLNDEVNVGLAVAVEDGLIVPVLHGADRLGLRETATRRHDLVTRAQAGALRPEDVRGGTFTISNLGMYGVDSFNAIINPPQAAILATGRIAERVIPVDGQPAVRAMMDLTLSCDHRVVDGARGALFLAKLANLIEEPLSLLD